MSGLGKAGASMLQKKYHIDREFSALVRLSGEMDEQLAAIDRLLDDEKLLELIEADLAKRYRLTTKTCRKSTPVEVILRMLALKHLRSLSYDRLIANVKESLILRQFCRLYFHALPDKSTLIRWSHQISAQTLEKINQRLTQIATELKITQGQKMRTDGTVVATNIHFPSDNSLLSDGVKVISRLLAQAKAIIRLEVKTLNPNLFRHRYRTARRISRAIDSWSKAKNQTGQQKRLVAYIDLGIKQVILPKGGYRSQSRIQHERLRKFVKGRHWHNGVEGRISFLKRCFGFQRCRDRSVLASPQIH
jgi:IS5 family transposase